MTENDVHEAITKLPKEQQLAIECNGNVENLKKLEKTIATVVNVYMSSYGEFFKYMNTL